MELKKYQNEVLSDLKEYIDNLLISRNPSKAYNLLWMAKNVRVGYEGMQPYKELLPGVPSVCLKVPTGGGKTLLGCASLNVIFDKMPLDKKKVVVWLVPWDQILTQTYDSFSDKNHIYRQLLDRDFNSRVEIYNKKQVLAGQNFNISSIDGQLSIIIMSFDSLRSRNKESRKVYEENSNLSSFDVLNSNDNPGIDGVDNSALMQVLNKLNPVVIVDESHNASSELSGEMIKDLNPSFVVELTATPKKSSNIISIVSAERLKQENMIKLPVIAFNRPSVERVIVEAIDLRNRIEKEAINEGKTDSSLYIRPIVLFQAQPKSSDDNVTFEKLKKNLIDSGIPEEYIAIKTSTINELKNVDLKSKNCKIRYIITVNALKEGWDCPFAYILASVANKSSAVDVEQILGRILRQPNQRQYQNKLLNMSYVLTSSSDFNSTLTSIIAGLNSAGFSKNDCRVIDTVSEVQNETPKEVHTLFDNDSTGDADDIDSDNFNIEAVTREIKSSINETKLMDEGEEIKIEATNPVVNALVDEAILQNNSYEKQLDEYVKEDNSGLAHELIDKMDRYKMCDNVTEVVSQIKIPQFCAKVENSIFSGDGEVNLISKDDLTDGFTLSSIGTPGNLSSSIDNVFKIDVEVTEDGSVAKQYLMKKSESEEFKSMLQMVPEKSRVSNCKLKLITDLNKKFKSINHSDFKSYIDRIVDGLNEDQIVDLQNNIMSAELKIVQYIENELEKYRYKKFVEDLNVGNIFCSETYSFPKYIYPNTTISQFPNTMYSEEEDNLSDVEIDFVNKVSGLDNIVCWHRIIDKKGFCLNGYINHYPDFVVITKSKKVILVETKGEHLTNDDTKYKLDLGNLWSSYAGPDKYKYFMAFLKNPMPGEGSYLVDRVIEIIKNL